MTEDSSVLIYKKSTSYKKEQITDRNIQCILLLKDGRLAMSHEEKGIIIYDLATDRMIILKPFCDGAVIYDMVQQKDGSLVCNLNIPAMILTLNGKWYPIYEISRPDKILSLSDGRLITTSYSDNNMIILDDWRRLPIFNTKVYDNYQDIIIKV